MTQNPQNGWTPERRAKQAQAIKRWSPWSKSTGPKSDTGKKTSRYNAYKHGCRSAGALKLRAALARQSRWLGEVVRVTREKRRIEIIEKFVAREKNATNELMDLPPSRLLWRGAAETIRTKMDGRAGFRPPRNGETPQFSFYKPPDSCMVRPHE